MIYILKINVTAIVTGFKLLALEWGDRRPAGDPFNTNNAGFVHEFTNDALV